MRLLTTIAELDEALAECDQAQQKSDDALRLAFNTFALRTEALALPPDPDSEAYRDAQFELYRRVSGREYKVVNEFSNWLKVDEATAVPFPYYTESFETVSDQTLAIGLIIKTMRLPAKARILEFGPGWGNTTVALARMGYQVTAIDIEPRFLEIIRGRARGFVDNLTLLEGDFSAISTLTDQFDAILFYESFHHCADHQRLVGQLEARVKQGGIVVFAAEPIYDGFPMPWGLRLDGQSLWAIRNFGWLELGFQEGYFRDLMGRHGWAVDKHVYDLTPLGTIYVARRGESNS